MDTKLTWNAIFQDEKKFEESEFPKVSIVVPTFNCSEKISLTIESVLSQEYPDYELIIVDGGSTDRTLEVVKNYRNEHTKVFHVSGNSRYEMLNKGIFQASGKYINFMFPGDFYIHNRTIRQMMEFSLSHQKPDLIYCGTSIRDGRSAHKVLLRDFSSHLLRNGQQPTSLQSCWFLTSTVKKLGKFNVNYTLRGGYDLMCRFSLNPNLRVACTKRILIDYDLRYVTLSMVTAHFTETWITICKHFGILAALRWLFFQKDFGRIIVIWLRTLKTAFSGR